MKNAIAFMSRSGVWGKKGDDSIFLVEDNGTEDGGKCLAVFPGIGMVYSKLQLQTIARTLGYEIVEWDI